MPEITTKQASQILGIDRRTIWRWVKKGYLESKIKPINYLVFDEDYIRSFAMKLPKKRGAGIGIIKKEDPIDEIL